MFGRLTHVVRRLNKNAYKGKVTNRKAGMCQMNILFDNLNV